MLIVNLLVNEKLLNAEAAFRRADSQNLVELCRNYLSLLNEYRAALYQLRGTPEIDKAPPSLLARELTEQVRKAIRSAIEITTRERNLAENLLISLTAISGYEAMETFNQLKYKGFENWELRAGGVRPKTTGDVELISIEESVKTAALLRCEEYVAHKTTFFRHSEKDSLSAENQS